MKHIGKIVAAEFKTPGKPMVIAAKEPDARKFTQFKQSYPLTRVFVKKLETLGAATVKAAIGKEVREFEVQRLLTLG